MVVLSMRHYYATFQMSVSPVARGLESVTEELEHLSVAAGKDEAPADAVPAPEPKLLKSQFQKIKFCLKYCNPTRDGI